MWLPGAEGMGWQEMAANRYGVIFGLMIMF